MTRSVLSGGPLDGIEYETYGGQWDITLESLCPLPWVYRDDLINRLSTPIGDMWRFAYYKRAGRMDEGRPVFFFVGEYDRFGNWIKPQP